MEQGFGARGLKGFREMKEILQAEEFTALGYRIETVAEACEAATICSVGHNDFRIMRPAS